MFLFQHLALGNRHHHWWTLSPLTYNLNCFAKKPKKTGVFKTSYDWVFFLNTMKNPTVKKNCVVPTLLAMPFGWPVMVIEFGPHMCFE